MVNKEDEKAFSEMAIRVSIDDECAGEFVVITSQMDGWGKVAINPEEWPMVRAAIDQMITECREDNFPKQHAVVSDSGGAK